MIKSKYELFIIVCITAVVVMWGIGAKRSAIDKYNITKHCVKTELVYFGGNHKLSYAYDCTGVYVRP